jgi:hypothetical protein
MGVPIRSVVFFTFGSSMALFGPPFWPLTTAQPHPRATVVLVDEVDAGGLLATCAFLERIPTHSANAFDKGLYSFYLAASDAPS